jgi:hypothetical protein
VISGADFQETEFNPRPKFPIIPKPKREAPKRTDTSTFGNIENLN